MGGGIAMNYNEEQLLELEVEETTEIEEVEAVPGEYLGDDDPLMDMRFEIFLAARELLTDWNPFIGEVH